MTSVLPRFAGARPSSVVECATPADVARALGTGPPVVVRGGGHCFAGRSTTTGVVIDVRPMAGIEVDGDVAVIGAGARLAEVYAALAVHGRTLPAGCGATVGIAGLTLGGGLGILGRRNGLTCDSLIGATMVRADGAVVEADDDLMWVLRGGGAPGVVTSLTFRTVPVPSSTAFRLTYPVEAAADVLDAWQDALAGMDPPVAASCVITDATVAVFGAAPHAFELPGVRPASREQRHGSHVETKAWLAGDDVPDPGWAYLHSEFHREPVRPADLIALLTADPVPGERRELDFSPWGGAYNDVAADATAFPHRDATFLLKQTATVEPGATPGPWLDASFALTSGTGGRYPNFPEPGVPDEAFYLGNTARRRAVRDAYDPGGVFAS